MTCYKAQKEFYERTIKLLSSIGAEFQTNRKMHSRPENASFLQIGPGKLYKSYVLQKPAAPSCSSPDRRDQLVSTSSTSQLDMKGKAPRKTGLCFPFSCKEFPAHQRWTAKGEKDKGAKKTLSQPRSYTELHDNTSLDKTELFCLSRLWAESPKAWIPAEAEEGTNCT